MNERTRSLHDFLAANRDHLDLARRRLRAMTGAGVLAILGVFTQAKADSPACDRDSWTAECVERDSGAVEVLLHVSDWRVYVRVEGEQHLVDRALVVDPFGEPITLHITSTGEASTMFVSCDGQWIETVPLDGELVEYVLPPTPGASFGFEFGGPGQGAPTSPDIILMPLELPPEPE